MNKMLSLSDGRECLFDVPDICPHCGMGFSSEALTVTDPESSEEYGAAFLCPVCRCLIFARYKVRLDNETQEPLSRRLAVYPPMAPAVPIPRKMYELYPDFYALYEQAATAEHLRLDKICGMAYRKALETLVKQYLINTDPQNESDILEESLSASIKRIEDALLQSLAKAASWIGNDATHLQVRHPEWNIEDMKGFILAMCHYILFGYEAKRAKGLIESRG